jgi:lia operon protein LiaG
MKNTAIRKIVVISAIVAAVGLGGAAILWFTLGLDLDTGRHWNGVTIDERESFALDAIEEIVVSTAGTDVEIVSARSAAGAGGSASRAGGGPGTIEAHLSGITSREDTEPPRRLRVLQTGGTLRIEVEHPEIFDVSLAGLGRPTLRLELDLPGDFSGRLEIKTASGKVKLRDRRVRELAIRTVSGDIEMEAVEADALSLRSTSGEARVDGLEASAAAVSTVSGDFYVAGFGGSLQAESTSGSLEVDFSELAGDVEVSSVSGDVELSLPRDAAFGLEARSTSGEVTCRFPIELAGSGSRDQRNSIVGTVGTAGNRIRIKTVSGDIRVAY